MSDKVLSFPKKYDFGKIDEFVVGYAKAFSEVKPEDQPTNIFLLEIYKDGTTRTLDDYIGGPMLHIAELLGTIEAWKMTQLLNGYIGDPE